MAECDHIRIGHRTPKSFEDWRNWIASIRGTWALPTNPENQRMAWRRYLKRGFNLTSEGLHQMEENQTQDNSEGGMKLKHVAALLNDKATTVECRFGTKGGYTYRVTQELAAKLRAFQAEYKGIIKLVTDDLKEPALVGVHDEPQLDLEANIDYRWIIGIYNDYEIAEAKKQEKAILDGLQTKQRGNAKEQVLRSFGLESVAQLLENKE